MKCVLIAVALLSLSACGGSPAAPAPTPPAPTPIPAAAIVSAGGGTFSFCNQFGCIFDGPMRNSGAGCANAIRGTVTFTNGQGQLLSTLQWNIASATIVRPGENFVFTVSGPGTLSTTATYRIDPSWTDVRCP